MIPRDQSEQGLKDAKTLSRYEYKVTGPRIRDIIGDGSKKITSN